MKKLSALILALAAASALLVPTGAAQFRDVSPNAYYAEAVDWAVKEGVTTGFTATTFGPDAPCSNAQILTFMWRANGKIIGVTDFSETGLELGKYYSDAVRWALNAGLIQNEPFDPDLPCTRAMAVEYFWKMAGKPQAFLDPKQFSDVSPDDDCAAAIAWALDKGITKGGKDGTFSPDATCTRAQIVTFLHRAMEA